MFYFTVLSCVTSLVLNCCGRINSSVFSLKAPGSGDRWTREEKVLNVSTEQMGKMLQCKL